MLLRSLAFLAAVCCSAAICAKAPQSIALSPAEFAMSRADIEKELQKTKRYSELTQTQREELFAALDRMEAVLKGVESADALPKDAQTQLFNDQELVNNVLTRAYDDSRLICKREKRVGSHRYTNTCITAGERRRQRDALQRDAQYLQRGDSLLSD